MTILSWSSLCISEEISLRSYLRRCDVEHEILLEGVQDDNDKASNCCSRQCDSPKPLSLQLPCSSSYIHSPSPCSKAPPYVQTTVLINHKHVKNWQVLITLLLSSSIRCLNSRDVKAHKIRTLTMMEKQTANWKGDHWGWPIESAIKATMKLSKMKKQRRLQRHPSRACKIGYAAAVVTRPSSPCSKTL